MPSYIDFGEALKGFTGAAQALGAINTLQRDFKYGDREAEANIIAKETANKRDQIELEKAQRLQEQEQLDRNVTDALHNFHQLNLEIAQQSNTGAPLSDKASQSALGVVAQNRYVADNLANNNFDAIREYTGTVKSSMNILDSYYKTGKMDPVAENQLKVNYVTLNKQANGTIINPDDVRFTPDDKGVMHVYLVDQTTGQSKMIDQNPVQTLQNMSVQSKVIDSYMNDLVAKNISKVSPQMRNYLYNVQAAQKLATMLPKTQQDAVMLRVNLSNPDALNTAMPSLFDAVEKNAMSEKTQSILKAVRNIPVVGESSGKKLKGGTFGKWMITNQDPTALHKGMSNLWDSIQNDPQFASIKQDIADSGMTKDQLGVLLVDPQLKDMKESLDIRYKRSEINKNDAATATANAQTKAMKLEQGNLAMAMKIEPAIEAARKVVDNPQSTEEDRKAAKEKIEILTNTQNDYLSLLKAGKGKGSSGKLGNKEVPLPGSDGKPVVGSGSTVKGALPSKVGATPTKQSNYNFFGGELNNKGTTTPKQKAVEAPSPYRYVPTKTTYTPPSFNSGISTFGNSTITQQNGIQQGFIDAKNQASAAEREREAQIQQIQLKEGLSRQAAEQRWASLINNQ